MSDVDRESSGVADQKKETEVRRSSGRHVSVNAPCHGGTQAVKTASAPRFVLREIIVVQLGVSPDAVIPSARFIDDLGLS